MEHLHSLSTKELLNYLQSARRCGGSYNPYYESGYSLKESTWYTIEEIKFVLNTRKHVPSKAERKKIRQENARKRG